MSYQKLSKNLVILKYQRYLPQGGEAIWHYWNNSPGELGGWRPNQKECTPISYNECLEILNKFIPNGEIVIQAVNRSTFLQGIIPQASEGPGESACSGSFCEIADRYDKGGVKT